MEEPATCHATVKEIMARFVVTITMDDTLAKAQQLFAQHHFHHLLVTENGRLVGIISDRDLLKATSPFVGTFSETSRDRATLTKRVHQIMRHNPITVKADTPVEAAARLLIEKDVSCLPVVSKEDRVEGILSWRDLLEAAFVPSPTRS
jgi:acetoin utilization protein AcuB